MDAANAPVAVARGLRVQHLAGLQTAKPVSLEDLSRPDTFPAKAFLRELCLSHFQDLTLPVKLKLRLRGYKPCPAYSAEGLATRMGRTSPPVPQSGSILECRQRGVDSKHDQLSGNQAAREPPAEASPGNFFWC